MKTPRILLYDIESAPLLAWVWEMRETDVIAKKMDWYVLSYAYKWLGDKKVTTVALPDFKGYKKNKEDDYELIKTLWEKFDEADVICGHNSNFFDNKKATAKFIKHRLPPPSPYKTFDTLKAARKVAAFPSNKLDNLAKDLGFGSKLPHTGFSVWQGCMLGDPKAWKVMRAYNAQDVVLLEKLYLTLRPWTSHPNVNLGTDRHQNCPTCSSPRLKREGHRYTMAGAAQRYSCLDCLAWCVDKPEKLARPLTLK